LTKLSLECLAACWTHLNTSLLRESEPGAATARLEDNVLALEEDVTEDAEADTLVGLDTTEAGTVTNGRIVDEPAGNSLLDSTHSNSKVGQSSSAGEDVTALGRRVLGTADLGVVGANNGGVGVDKGGAGVDDTVN
jgi:hypothetical protein